MSQRTLFTIGHSTRAWAEFVALLVAWKIQELVDVRTAPGSRAFPWFCKDRMEKALPKSGIAYLHLPALGGLRRASKDSSNTGWENERFAYTRTTCRRRNLKAGLGNSTDCGENGACASCARKRCGGVVIAG